MQHYFGLIDPVALAAVWIGTLILVTAHEGYSGFTRSVKACRKLYRLSPAKDAQAAQQIIYRVETVLDKKGAQCLDRVRSKDPFVAGLISRWHSGELPTQILRAASLDMNRRELRHNDVIRFWKSVAETAPAIGMMGTVVGLSQMFQKFDDPNKVGSAMAIALLTTLYGLLFSNAVANPIAQRLLRLSSEELKWQQTTADRIVELANVERRKQDCFDQNSGAKFPS